jgi:hypothetical protein
VSVSLAAWLTRLTSFRPSASENPPNRGAETGVSRRCGVERHSADPQMSEGGQLTYFYDSAASKHLKLMQVRA